MNEEQPNRIINQLLRIEWKRETGRTTRRKWRNKAQQPASNQLTAQQVTHSTNIGGLCVPYTDFQPLAGILLCVHVISYYFRQCYSLSGRTYGVCSPRLFLVASDANTSGLVGGFLQSLQLWWRMCSFSYGLPRVCVPQHLFDSSKSTFWPLLERQASQSHLQSTPL